MCTDSGGHGHPLQDAEDDVWTISEALPHAGEAPHVPFPVWYLNIYTFAIRCVRIIN